MVMIGEFLDYLRFEKNRSELTVSSYAEDLKAFEAYFKIWTCCFPGRLSMPMSSVDGWKA